MANAGREGTPSLPSKIKYKIGVGGAVTGEVIPTWRLKGEVWGVAGKEGGAETNSPHPDPNPTPTYSPVLKNNILWKNPNELLGQPNKSETKVIEFSCQRERIPF